MSCEPVVRASGLCKTHHIFKSPAHRLCQALFGGTSRNCTLFHALSDVSFTVAPGQTLGIIGRNGSGKSTLLQCLGGLTTPSAGEVEVRGRTATLLELGAGFNPEFTGRENVLMAASVLGLDPARIRSRFPSIEEFAGIGPFMDHPLRTYSSGMSARLAFAVAAHADAEVMLVDEVLAVGDAAFTQRCMRFLRQFKQRGILVLVSHDASAVLSLCDQALWLDQGCMRAYGPTKEVCFSYLADINGSSAAMVDNFSRPAQPARPDHRHEALRRAGFDNSIELFDFTPLGPDFGRRGAEISNVCFVDADTDLTTASLCGGEEVSLEVTCTAHIDLERPIVGFYVKDRLGQYLFGDNTFLTYRTTPSPIKAGQPFAASFRFAMPYLPSGDYSVCAAVADGDQTKNVQHHWLDEALQFRVESSHVVRGLVGIPMQSVQIRRVGGTKN